jgi:hypothetical protein
MPMRRIALVLLAVPLAFTARPARAQDSYQNISYFYPLRTRRPVIERELELRVEHAKGAEGRTTEAAAALELPIMPRWQVELEVPLVFNDPRDGASQGGVGDVSLETKVAVWQSLDWLSQVAIGVEGRFPTGSERRWSRSSPAASRSAISTCWRPWRTSSTSTRTSRGRTSRSCRRQRPWPGG